MINRALRLLTPPAFVVLWATGFIVARLVAPHTEPLTFLSLRFAAAAALLSGGAFMLGAAWPTTLVGWRDAFIAGILLHGLYLSSVFWAVKQGLPAGIAALIAGLQPLTTALLAGPLLGERVSGRRWLGIAIGFAGAGLVLSGKIDPAGAAYPVSAATVCFAGVLSVTLGTLWQKRTGGQVDLRTGTAIQYLGALALDPVATLSESGRIDPAPAFWIGLVWSTTVLSIGAVGLLLLMIRRGEVAAVASLMYLVPPVAAVFAFILFGETLGPVQIGGIALAAIGVALANRG